MSAHQESKKAAQQARMVYQAFNAIRRGELAVTNALIMSVFRFQSSFNQVYKDYLSALGRDPAQISDVTDIPFLPISLFKSHAVKSWDFEPAITFTSSGTTGQVNSQHLLSDPQTYETVALQLFERRYGPCQDWVFLALLPSYLERTGSSLIHMVDLFIKKSGQPDSGFFLYDLDRFRATYNTAKNRGCKVFILGVSFALLDLAESMPFKLSDDDVLMETGGMKGRRKELVREELHLQLMQAFGVKQVHSEYGMTELLSQAYASKDGRYSLPPWMQIYIRDVNDPFRLLGHGKTGGINIIDLANIDSCAFLQTQDLGKMISETDFEVLGRFDNSELRGCNLMVS